MLQCDYRKLYMIGSTQWTDVYNLIDERYILTATYSNDLQ